MSTVSFDAASLGRTARVASGFWVLCIVLGLVEVALGENAFSSVVFLFSIPLLVGALIFANRMVLRSRNRASALATVALSVLVYASLIIFVGIYLASAVLELGS